MLCGRGHVQQGAGAGVRAHAGGGGGGGGGPHGSLRLPSRPPRLSHHLSGPLHPPPYLCLPQVIKKSSLAFDI